MHHDVSTVHFSLGVRVSLDFDVSGEKTDFSKDRDGVSVVAEGFSDTDVGVAERFDESDLLFVSGDG